MEAIIQSLKLTSLGTEACRIFHGRARPQSEFHDVVIDFYPPTILIILYRPRPEQFIQQLIGELLSLYQGKIANIFLQKRYEFSVPSQMVWGDGEATQVLNEFDLKYEIALTQNQNAGFFLDMRNLRQELFTISNSKRVLNLFSYTGSLSVAAIQGKAKYVLNVDMSSASLNRARRNHELNFGRISHVEYQAVDLLKSWGMMKRKGPFDIVIIDPPTDQGKHFWIERDYQKIIRRLNDWIVPGALVVACLNSPKHPSSFLINLFEEHAPQFKFIKKIRPPEIFQNQDCEQELKVLFFQHQILGDNP